MKKLKKLLGKINIFASRFSKKAYSNGLVLVVGGFVTILLLGSNQFFVDSQAAVGQKEIVKEDELNEDPDLESADLIAIEALEDGSQSYLFASAISQEFQMISVAKEYSQMIVSMMKEEESEKEVLLTASQSAYNYSEADYQALLDIVEAEAHGGDVTGKMMVANVVLNRMEDDRFPDTIYDVIYQKSGGKYQFSPVGNGKIGSFTITESTVEAVDRALSGEDNSSGAFYFVGYKYASEKSISWFEDNLVKVAEYGGHYFYSY